jgi:hypothetical protein
MAGTNKIFKTRVFQVECFEIEGFLVDAGDFCGYKRRFSSILESLPNQASASLRKIILKEVLFRGGALFNRIHFINGD